MLEPIADSQLEALEQPLVLVPQLLFIMSLLSAALSAYATLLSLVIVPEPLNILYHETVES